MITSKFNGFNPYIFKAYYDYIVDHDDIPHLLVNPRYEGTVLPAQFSAAEELILSVSPNAVRGFVIGAKGLSFDTKFSGRIFSVFLPYGCIYEIIATESKIAIPIRVFFVSDSDDDEDADEEAVQKSSSLGNDSEGFEILSDSQTASLDEQAPSAQEHSPGAEAQAPQEPQPQAQEEAPAAQSEAQSADAPAPSGQEEKKEQEEEGEPDFTIV